MQRAFLVSLLLLMATSVAQADRQTYDPTKTQIALPLDTPPTIDGVIDPASEWQKAGGATSGAGNFWIIEPNANLEDGIRGGSLGDGAANPPTSAADLRFIVWAGYDSKNLYIAVRVNDDVIMNDDAAAESANGSTWLDDCVEVFVDGDNSNYESRDTSGTLADIVATGGQYVITANNAYREAEAGNPGYGETQAWYARTAIRDDGSGYDAEFRISLSALGNPKPGDIIGFSVAVDDDDDGTAAERQLIWVGKPHTEVSYGNLLLGSRSYDAPKTKAPTIDGKINAAEYAGAKEIVIAPHTAIWDSAGDDTFEATDASFSAWAVHDADAIYVAVDVTDDQLVNDTAEAGSDNGSTWEDDSVEIFFDADMDRNVGGQTLGFEGQYVFTANGARRENEASNPAFGADADWFAATTKTDKGYQVEFKVKKTALSSPADGAKLGFQIAMNDDDGSGRKSQPGWSGRAHSEFTYGTLTLSASGGTTEPPTVLIGRTAAGVKLTYTGTLQAADAPQGPYTDVTGSASPYEIQASAKMKFYRAKK